MGRKICRFHKWNKCTCEKCGATRHKWGEDCKCSRCGQQHDWRPYVNCVEMCAQCGARRNDPASKRHKWNTVKNPRANGCKCTVCGAINNYGRFAAHTYEVIENSCDLVCSVCGYIDEGSNHDAKHCTCQKCGKVFSGKRHDWVKQGCFMVCSVCGLEITNGISEDHDWEILADCKKKCRKCGDVENNHTYKAEDSKTYTITEYDNGWPNKISWTEIFYTCTVCGHKTRSQV